MGLVCAACALPFAACEAVSTACMVVCCCCKAVNCACSAAKWATCCCRTSLGRRTGVSPTMAKLFYIIIFACSSILALILRFNSPEFDLGVLTTACSSGNITIPIPGLPDTEFVYCKGTDAVYRISFVLTLFFALMIPLSAIHEGLHRGFWFFKVLLIMGAIAGCFFIPAGVLDTGGFTWVARLGSAFFLFLQVLVLVDFAYNWNEDWVNRAYAGALTETSEPTDKHWLYLVLSSAFLLYCMTITGIVLLYVYFPCSIGDAFTSVLLVICLILTVVSLFRDKIVGVPGAILPVAVVNAYVVFLTWSALQSNPDPTCIPGAQTALTIILGGVFAIITLCWTTFSLTQNSAHLVQGEELEKNPEVVEANQRDTTSHAAGAPVTSDIERGAHKVNATPVSGGEEDDEPWPTTENPVYFHAIMFTASLYIAMLLSDWGTDDTYSLVNPVASGNASMWVKEAVVWLTSLMFLWTLVAPGVLKNRDFS